MQTYHFDEIVDNEGVVTLPGLPPLEKVAIVVIRPESFDWEKEMDAWMLEMQKHPFAKMSEEEILAHLRQTRDEVYEEVYGHPESN